MSVSFVATGVQFPDASIQTTAMVLPSGILKAWVNFNGSTANIRSSGNVSSVTRNSTGDYNVNFTTAMADTNYSIGISSDLNTSNGLNVYYAQTSSTSYAHVSTYGAVGGGAGAYRDTTGVFVQIFA